MLKIVQAGQADENNYLLAMHRLRKHVFKDKMGWNVPITSDGLEIDQFDTPDAVYLLALNNDYQVIGNWRLLPCTGPIMVREIWPHFLSSLPIPYDPHVWEASRFAVYSPQGNSDEGLAQVSYATQELFCGLTELCLLCGIGTVYTMYNMQIARLLKRLNCAPFAVSERQDIEGNLSQVGAFMTDYSMLQKLRHATGIKEHLITEDMLPALLKRKFLSKGEQPCAA